MNNKKFSTALCCIDGRITIPVIEKIKELTGTDYVDFITGPGIDKTLCGECDEVENIKEKINVSIKAHNSSDLCIVGHTDCAGNPVECDQHECHVKEAASRFSQWFPQMQVLGLVAVDSGEDWEVKQI